MLHIGTGTAWGLIRYICGLQTTPQQSDEEEQHVSPLATRGGRAKRSLATVSAPVVTQADAITPMRVVTQTTVRKTHSRAVGDINAEVRYSPRLIAVGCLG